MTDDLIDGFHKFKKEAYDSKYPLMPHLVKNGQAPDYFMISCIDSRTNPGIIFNTPPGTFFAHKAMGAIVRPYKKGTALSAALQFAVKYNHVKTIIIMGHTDCGAIKSLVENLNDSEISSFTDVAHECLQRAKNKNNDDNLQRHTEEEIVLLSRENLKSYPAVRYALANDKIEIKCWIFDMKEGELLEYNDETTSFNIIGK